MSDTRGERKPVVIDAPDVPADEAGPGDAESQAVAAHPEFQRVIAEGRKAFKRGEGVDAEDVFRELCIDEHGGEKDTSERRRGTTTNGHDAGQPSPTAARPAHP